MHDGTVDVPGPTGREGGLDAQVHEARTEEDEGRVLGPETRHPGVGAVLEGVDVHVVFLRHIRLHADKGGFLVTPCGVSVGELRDLEQEAAEEVLEDVGFVHGGVAMCTRRAEVDVVEGIYHGSLGDVD